MRKCREDGCEEATYTHYDDYYAVNAGKPNVFIRDAKLYVCPRHGQQGVSIHSLTRFTEAVENIPPDHPYRVYLAVDHLGNWFQLPHKEGFV